MAHSSGSGGPRDGDSSAGVPSRPGCSWMRRAARCYRLLPGTPVLPAGAWLDGQLVPLDAAPETARTYAAGAPRLEGEWSTGRLRWVTRGTLGGEPFVTRHPPFDHNDDRSISRHAPAGDGSLITRTRKCGELRFTGPRVEEPKGRAGMYGVLGALREQPGTRIREGAALYWDDGHRAGTAVRTRGVDEVEVEGDAVRCVDGSLGGNLPGLPRGAVRLCARAEDWEPVKPQSLDTLFGRPPPDLFEQAGRGSARRSVE